MANIDYYLKINQLPPLKRLRKAGVSLAVAEEFLPALCSLLSSFRVKDLLLKPEERINLIMKILVGQRSYITIEALADRLGVSKGTVLNDLGKLRQGLKKCRQDQSTPDANVGWR